MVMGDDKYLMNAVDKEASNFVLHEAVEDLC